MCRGCWSLDSQQMSKGKLIANTPRPKFKGLSGLGLWYVQLQITAEQLVFTSDHMHMHISKACASCRWRNRQKEDVFRKEEEDDTRDGACN